MRCLAVLSLALSLPAAAAGPFVGAVQRVDEVHASEVPVTTGRAAVATDGVGWLAVWEDKRDPLVPQALFGTRIDGEGQVLDPIGFPVVQTQGATLMAPRLAFGGGVYLLAWLERTSGQVGVVHAQRFSADGTPLDEAALDLGGDHLAGVSDLQVAYGDGVFWVVWKASNSGTSSTIYAARVTPQGQPLDPTGGVMVEAGASGYHILGLSVAGGPDGAMVAWAASDASALSWQVLATPLTGGPEGVVVGEASAVTPADATYRHMPAVARLTEGWLVAWTVTDNVDADVLDDVWAARVGDDGAPIAAKMPLATGPFRQRAPGLAPYQGGFLLVFSSLTDYLVPGKDLYALRLGADGAAVGDAPVALGLAAAATPLASPACAGARCEVAWAYNHGSSSGTRAMRAHLQLPVAPEEVGLGPSVLQHPNQQTAQRLATDGEQLLLTWSDDRADAPGYYGVEIDETGAPTGQVFALPAASSYEVAGNAGVFMLVWYQNGAVRARGVTASGALVGTATLQLSNPGEGSFKLDVASAQGGFIAGWLHHQNVCSSFGCNLQTRLYYRFVSLDGVAAASVSGITLPPATTHELRLAPGMALARLSTGSAFDSVVSYRAIPVPNSGSGSALPIPDGVSLHDPVLAGSPATGWQAAFRGYDSGTGLQSVFVAPIAPNGAWGAPTALTATAGDLPATPALARSDGDSLLLWSRPEEGVRGLVVEDPDAGDFFVGPGSIQRAVEAGPGAFVVAVLDQPAEAPFDGAVTRIALRQVTLTCGPGACDDGEACTDDSCAQDTGECSHVPSDGAPCSDDDPCTTGDTCHAGACEGAPTDCEDGNPCTIGACDEQTGSCSQTPVSCDDGLFCTVDTCDTDSGCIHPPLDCSDDNPCTLEGCDEALGLCWGGELTCDDGDFCTTDICSVDDTGDSDAVCSWIPRLCDDDQVCTLDACLAGACVHTPATDGLPCDDDVFCTTADTCQSGICAGAWNPQEACDDGSPCTLDDCSLEQGCIPTPLADETPCDDGNGCTSSSECTAGQCVGTGEWTCGSCTTDLACTDDNACTTDVCIDGYGCVNTPKACSDGDPCTIDLCFAQSGACWYPPASCDDGEPCTMDHCEAAEGGCVHEEAPDGEVCDDQTACTVEDACSGGVCQGLPAECDDGDACTADACEPAVGCLHALCDDGDACTEDECLPEVGCASSPKDCDDMNLCTTDLCDSEAGCIHIAKACAEPSLCEGQCNPLTGICRAYEFSCHGFNPCYLPDCGYCVLLPNCDDGNACTADECDPVLNKCTNSPVTCDDGDLCTTDYCEASGGCFHAPTICDDGSLCTADSCSQATGECVYEPMDCSDGFPCTADSCDAGTGLCSQSPLDCDDGDDCTRDYCNPTMNGDPCVHEPIAAGICGTSCTANTHCNDNSPCTTEACIGGQCVHGHVCDGSGASDALYCTLDECVIDEGTASCVSTFYTGGIGGNPAQPCTDPCETHDQCDDGSACTISSCDASGGCLHVPKVCDDGSLCTVDECDAATGACLSFPLPCDDGNSCTTDQCDGSTGACSNAPAGDGGPCDDADPCTATEVCTDGVCLGQPLPCDDENECTTDECHPPGGCLFTPIADGEPCDDGDACTAADACGSGACAGEPVACDDGHPCTTDLCKPEDGTCANLPKVCDDGKPCTADQCDPQTGFCVNVSMADGALCDDDDPCTTSDDCQGQFCAGVPVTCDDGDPCTSDTCQLDDGSCVFTTMPASTPCDDGDACTIADTCGDEDCAGQPVVCDDGDPCTVDVCQSDDGSCLHAPADCDDGDPCTQDGCDEQTGECAAEPIGCDDGQPCTTDQCDPNTGACANVPAADGDPCEDGDPCTSADECGGGTCAGEPVACDDGDACTSDACEPAEGGCVFTPADDGQPCDDGDACTDGDACAGGACAGTPLTCDDGDACTADGCADGDCAFTPAADDTPCDDGNPCTTPDRCLGGACAGMAVLCDDADPCTADTCRTDDGGCHHEPLPECAPDDGAEPGPATDDTGAAAPGAPSSSCSHGPAGSPAATAALFILLGAWTILRRRRWRPSGGNVS